MKQVRIFSKSLMLAAAMVVGLSLISSPDAQAAEVAGQYNVAGINPDGEGRYEGKVVVQPAGDTYAVTWTVAGVKMSGVGILTEGPKDVFSVAYEIDGSSGLAVYTLDSQGRWAGQWTMLGAPDVGLETWLK